MAVLPLRPTKVDETIRSDHYFLNEGDECFFFGEYFAGRSYSGGDTNQLVFNLKCPPSAPAGRRHFKQQAIETVAAGLRRAISREQAEAETWVPIPPSRLPEDPDYDDRILSVLQLAFNGYNADIRTLIYQTRPTEADHLAAKTGRHRIERQQLYDSLAIADGSLRTSPLRRRIVLVDDVLNTGKHFSCCAERLRTHVKDCPPIVGLFIARSVHA